jgi:hypothetical protein
MSDRENLDNIGKGGVDRRGIARTASTAAAR